MRLEVQGEGLPWRRGFLGLELWCVDLKAGAASLLTLERQTARLPKRDWDFASTIADTRRAGEWLAAHVALRILLERAVGPKWRGTPFVRGAGVKPYLAGAPVTFSLSHVSGWSLVGVGSGEYVGVDLERARCMNIREPRRVMLQRAAAALSEETSLPEREDLRTLQAWVRLEAFAKADGRGIGRLLTQLGIVGSTSAQDVGFCKRLDEVKKGPPACKVHDLDIAAGVFAAAALPLTARPPAIFKFPSSISGIHELLS